MRMGYRGMMAAALLAGLWAPVQAAKLDEVFNGKMLGATQRYLESVAGVPRSEFGDVHEFEVQGCPVEATIVAGQVQALRLEIGPKCQPDLSSFIDAYAPPKNQALSFGGFEKTAGPLKYMADCLMSCGNAADPVVYGFWDGPRAAQFLQVLLEAEQVEDAALSAAGDWEAQVLKARGEDYVMDLGFNCDDQFNAQASKAFKAVKATAVTIGHDLAVPQALTQACPK